jgi:alpha-glucoside transport system permease protein
MFTKPPLRVSRLIAQETERAITINRLAELIKKANEEAGTNCSVSGKMLRKIRDNPEKVGLTWNSNGTDLRNGSGDQVIAKLLLAAIALAVGVGGIWLLFLGVGSLVSLLEPKWRDRILPWVFVGPALALLAVFLVYPAAGTVLRSLQDETGTFTFANFAVLLEPEFTAILRNNLIWLVVGTAGSVVLGLVFAGLFDRVRREAVAKTIVFLPLAISLVGASVIWQFVYAWQPEGQTQIGLLNAIVVGLGGEPIPWLTSNPLNIFCEIVILVWLQTGFAMVVFSAAIKGVSGEVLEAARLDGANERQLFVRVIVPMIRGSIITVSTTIAIVTLKIFDIVYVTNGGRFGDDVVANQMFLQLFQFFDDGVGAALATVLFIAVLPVMYINLRNFRRQGVGG